LRILPTAKWFSDDDLEPMAPQDHSFLEEKPSWLHADEHLPVSNWDSQNQD